ncbi:lysine decarboxylase [Pantoea ananatis]|uniref:Orn/Lys/Arg family decarboxylase n=1 Tax=Pantoea ananas TaxID=553 RepID=UPI000D5F9A7C|nr:lysine decarboxylase [Pantoea ananatis]PVY84677.1 arginine/lysine/ornithine decarboxylase [Pantoea ananatis]
MNARVINMTGSTPVLTRLKYLRERKFFSFHALPISSYGNSDIIGGSNSELTEHIESSVTGELFDSFFFPSGIISESQKLTAGLYNADHSFYITGGTSTANQIAISALYEKGERILVDKNCHQSVHFHTRSIGAEIHYICPDLRTEYEEMSAWSYEHLEQTLLTLQESGRACDMVILTAQSYEGVIYDIPGVLARLLAAGITTRKFFIDEAWGSLNYFSEDIRPFTAMNIDSLRQKYPDLEVICTHSAHKSLFCLRQASLIHCRGTDNLAERVETAKYRIHTTSPSYPIIASLDNAQAIMSEHGNALAMHSRSLVDRFVNGISSLKNLGSEAVSRQIFNSHWHVHYDPTKVILDVSSIGTGAEIKQRLCEENIYVKRVINNFLLFNFHIGINEQAVSALLSALDKICQEKMVQPDSENEISDKFIIPYPPGVPLVFPGEVIDEVIKSKIEKYRKNGFIIIAA